MRGPKFTLGGAAPPARPLVEKFSYSKSVLDHNCMCVTVQLSMIIPEILRGFQILRWGVNFSLKLVPHFRVKVGALLVVDSPSYCIKAAIVDVKFRCKVIRHLMSNSVSEMPIFCFFG